MSYYAQLKNIFAEIAHLQYLQEIIKWDEDVMMPEGAGSYRAEAMATFELTLQQKLCDARIPLYINLAKEEELSTWDKANLAWMESKYKMATAVPPELNAQMAQVTQECTQAWRRYRPENNWLAFAPHLEKLFLLKKKVAELKAKTLNCDPYDALLAEYSPGFNQETIDPIFDKIKATIPALRQQVMHQHVNVIKPPMDFPVEKQKKLSSIAMATLGFNLENGRLDTSAHPMTGGYSIDVRMTTRYSDDGIDSLFNILHETGHGLYEQGMPKDSAFQPVGHIQSMAMHEGQALLYENVVGRSKSFWHYFSAIVQTEFEPHPSLSPDNLYQYANRVKSNLIRVDADEISYPLHVALRYELEKRLFKSEISIIDLPKHWDTAMKAYFNISSEGNDKDGVMQDIHWSIGYFGYFPAYAIGQAIAAQLYSTFKKVHPEFDRELALGNLTALRHWLTTHVYQYASSLSTNELLIKVTGEPLNPDHLIRYIENKYLTPAPRAQLEVAVTTNPATLYSVERGEKNPQEEVVECSLTR